MKTLFLSIMLCFIAVAGFSQMSNTKAIGIPAHTASNISLHDATMYPNPVTDGVFRIKSDEVMLSVEVMNVVGQTVNKYVNEYRLRQDITIQMSNCEKGMYLVKITFEDNQSIIKKLLVK